jgi:hypothetical protein
MMEGCLVMICTEAEASVECSDMRGKLYLSLFFSLL